MEPLEKIESYLIARGCEIHKVQDHLVRISSDWRNQSNTWRATVHGR